MATVKKAQAKRMSLDEAMRALEKAGSEQTRKTYARHGAKEPMFGVSFATLKTLVKRIGVDHALALWDTGNFDARNLAVKVADPAKATSAVLDRWAGDMMTRMWCGYVAALAAEGPLGRKKAAEWLGKGSARRAAGWTLLAFLASLDADAPDSEFLARIAEIEKTIASARTPSAMR
jgi:3-methyladenine DNA glycosylase AlkD